MPICRIRLNQGQQQGQLQGHAISKEGENKENGGQVQSIREKSNPQPFFYVDTLIRCLS